MKKINLQDVKNGLSRNEMRKVKGGCGGSTPECGETCTTDSFCATNNGGGCTKCKQGVCAA